MLHEIKGLEGLKWYGDLSTEERNLFLEENKDILSKYATSPKRYGKAAATLYENKKFIDKFGLEEFNKLSPQERRDKYKSTIVGEAITAKYGKDSRFSEISNMTIDGQLDILQNNFPNDEEFNAEIAKSEKEANKLFDPTNEKTQMRDAITSAFGAWTPGIRSGTSADYKELTADAIESKKEKRQESLNTLLEKDYLRKIEQSKDLSSQHFYNFQRGLDEGVISEADIEEEFNKFVGGTSSHYRAFKDTDIFEHYTLTDKMKDLADFIAVNQKFGAENAVKSMNTKMQNYVSDNQNAWDWARNTTQNIVLKGAANLANKVMAAEALLLIDNKDALNNFLQGVDENGRELPWYNNPVYWQGVDHYNTPDFNEIKKAIKDGGVSPYQNITRAGEEMEFLSWNTANEAAKQFGYIWSEALASRLLGATGKGLGKLSSTLKTSKIAQGLGVTFDVGQSVAGMSFAEGMGSFQEALQQNNELIDNQINKEVADQVNRFSETEEFKKRVADKIRELSSTGNYKNKQDLELAAINEVLNEVQTIYTEEAEERHKEDRLQAGRSAVSAYATTATLFAIKEAATNSLFQRHLYNKGTRQALGDNGPKLNITTNADGTISASISKWNKYGRHFVEQPLVEFGEEFTDNLVNNFGQGFGTNDYLSYHNKRYDPEAYVEATDGVIGNILSGVNRVKDSFTEKDAYYEGFIGAVSGAGQGVTKSYQSYKYGKYIDAETERVNEILKKHGSVLQDIASAMSTMHEADVAITSGNTVLAIDSKQRSAFELVHLLQDLGNSPIGNQSDLYKNSMQTIEALASGNIQDEQLNELVTSFLAQPKNRTIAEKPDAREQAANLLVENAKSFINTQETINNFYEELDKTYGAGTLGRSVKKELAYLKLMGKNWQERLNSIEESIGGSKGTFNANAEFGSKKAFERKKASLLTLIDDNKRFIKNLERDLKDSELSKEEKAAKKLRKKALEHSLKKLKNEYNNLEKYSSIFNEEGYSSTLSKEEILSLPADQRAWMLDPKNLEDYSLEQQLVIEELTNELNTRNPDLLNQIRDASILKNRVEDAITVFSRMIKNPVEALQYIESLEYNRSSKLWYYYNKKRQESIETLFEGKSNEEAIEVARSLSADDLYDYIENHEDKRELLSGIQEAADFRGDASVILREFLGDNMEDYDNIVTSISDITRDSNNKEEAINVIEDAIDSEFVDANTKDILNKLLDKMGELDYQRNATKVIDRKAKQERQEAQKKEAEEALRRQEEAERIAKEEAEAKRKKNSPTNISDAQEDTGVLPDGSNVQETIEVDESKMGSEEQLQSAGDVNLDNIDNIERVESPTIEEQTSNDPSIVTIQTMSQTEVDKSYETPSDPTVLVGNTYYRYDGKKFKEEATQEKRVGEKEGDKINRIFKWFDSAGIQYQEIIDNELHDILEVNPKIQFLLVNPQENATDDKAMSDEVLLVVEYNQEVENIHNDSYGGVLIANGKRWLVIGSLGFNGSEQGNNYRSLKDGILKKKRYTYFNNNPTERFYVDPFYSTEVNKMDGGWITRKLEGDEEVKIRTIGELLKDANNEGRNPKNLKLKELKWGIQVADEFKTVRVSSRNKIHPPRDRSNNSGNTFLLLEGANGEFLPVAIKPVMYNEIKDGRLKDTIINLLTELTSTEHSKRYSAINDLVKLLYLKEKNILIGQEGKNTLSIVNGDITIKSFTLDSSFNRMDFLQAVLDLNPRINITTSSLSNIDTLEMLDEAGVLITDIAKLGTSNAGFSVYSVGADGNPIITTPVVNSESTSSDFINTRESVLITGQVYRKTKDGWVNDTYKVVTDSRLLEQIEYNHIIQSNDLVPVEYSKDKQEYYIISSDRDNPVAVKRKMGSNFITVASKEQSLALIDRLAKQEAERKAKEELSKIQQVGTIEDVVLEEDNDITQDDIYNQIIGDASINIDTIAENNSQSEEEIVSSETTPSRIKSMTELQQEVESKTVSDIAKDETYGDKLDAIIDQKISSGIWKEDIYDDIEEFFKSKGIPTTGITNTQQWLDLIEECK